MINVIVVPETDEFKHDLFHGEEIYINDALGEPNLANRNVKYIAPYLLKEQRVLRVYEILEMRHVPPSYEIYLGNSYRVKNGGWNAMGQHRKFEYHALDKFGFKEIEKGFLATL